MNAPKRHVAVARPSDIIDRDQRNRFLCRCVECSGPMPHHTADMICNRCARQLEADLEAMGFATFGTKEQGK